MKNIYPKRCFDPFSNFKRQFYVIQLDTICNTLFVINVHDIHPKMKLTVLKRIINLIRTKLYREIRR